MKKIAFIVAAASLFALAPLASRFGPVASSVALVWLGVLLAVAASGSAQSMAIAAGALGAFGSGVLSTVSPAAAGAVMVAAAFAERTTRVRNKSARALHVLVALVGGGLAGSLATAFTASSLPVLAVAVTVSGVLCALPLLVDADDPVAHALGLAAADVPQPVKGSLLDGAELRRQAEEIPLDRPTQDRVRKTWQSLVRLAEARVRLERSRPKMLGTGTADAVLTMVDQKIVEHVSVLAKAYTAVDTARAAAVGLDDAALKNVEVIGEALDEESRAMVEVRGAGAA